MRKVEVVNKKLKLTDKVIVVIEKRVTPFVLGQRLIVQKNSWAKRFISSYVKSRD